MSTSPPAIFLFMRSLIVNVDRFERTVLDYQLHVRASEVVRILGCLESNTFDLRFREAYQPARLVDWLLFVRGVVIQNKNPVNLGLI